MSKILTFLFFCLLILKAGFSGENPYIRHFGTLEGLLTNTVYHVSQDKEGFLWFSTDAGVVKYNGTVFNYYRKRDGLTDKEILWTNEDSRGRVWISAFKGNIQFYYNNKIFSQENTDYLKKIDCNEFIVGFYEDAEGSLFFYTAHGLIYCLNSENIVQKWQYPSIGRLYNITTTTDDRILFVTQNGLYISSNFNSVPVLYQSLDIVNVFRGDSSTYYILTNNDDLLKFKNESLQFSLKNPLNTQKIITVFTDYNGVLWLGTFDEGIYCYKDGRILINLPIKQAQHIFQDTGNNIWITSMNEGIYKILPGFTSTVHYPSSYFEENGITSVCQKGSEDVWLTNGSSIYCFSHGKIIKLYKEFDSFFIDIILEFKDQLLFGKKNDKLYAINFEGKDKTRNNFSALAGKKRLLMDFLKGYSFDEGKNEICIQHINDLYIYSANTSDKPKIVSVNERIYTTFYNRKDELIINSPGGISVLKNDTIIPCSELKQFTGKRIDGHVVINEIKEVYNIEGDSIWLLTDNRFINLSKGFAYPVSNPIVKVLYHDSFLYFTTTERIYRINLSLDFSDKTKTNLQLIDIRFNSIHDALFQNDTLFIASKDGLTLISQDEFNNFRNNIPIPYITNIQSNDIKLATDNDKNIKLRANNNLHIDFEAINYSESPLMYAYKLEGLEEKWNIGPETSVVYKNLSSQNYKFMLKARSYNADWSSPVELNIQIKPRFYQRTVFILACLIMLWAILHFVIRRYRINQKKHEEINYKLVTLEQKSLRAMMNPHFIFNSLGSIQNYLLQNKASEANLYLSQFARLIRQNLNSANSAFISLEDETDRLMNYLSLEKLRLDDKFEFSINIDPQLKIDEVFIPTMIIQPFVENAVWHGISPLDMKGHIAILFNQQSDKSLMVSIEDNGIGIKQSKQYLSANSHISIGMEATQKRLQLLCRQHHRKFDIRFEEVFPGKPNPGTRIRFVIPFREDPEIS